MNIVSESQIGVDLIDAIVPDGGWLVALAEVYIDESGSHGGSPVLCVGGYVFRKREAREFTREWGKRLAREELAFWHTNPAAQGHGSFPFTPAEAWPGPRVDKLQRALIGRVRKQASFGFAITVNEPEYQALVPAHPDLGGAYSFCLRNCLIAVRSWCDRVGFQGRIAYFFEAGHADAAEADEIMRRVFKEPRLQETYRYASHTFADKRCALPLQAADLLAWHWHTDSKRRRAGIFKSRQDCIALVSNADCEVMDWTSERLHDLALGVRSGRIQLL